MSEKSVQELHAPTSICFGCGPANAGGLRIRSFPSADGLVCEFSPQAHHQAFPGMVNGGIIGALLDCHSNWTAAMHLVRTRGLHEVPCTVTAEFAVKLRRPTPMTLLHVSAKCVETDGDKVTVEATLEAEGKLCATCRGVFVAVREGHPAYRRWA